MKLKTWTSVIVLASLPNIGFTAGISAGELNAATCFSCHGPEGKPVGSSIPPLGVYPPGYIAQSLKDIKNGKRNVSIMDRHIKGYTDAEIDAIAEYIDNMNKK